MRLNKKLSVVCWLLVLIVLSPSFLYAKDQVIWRVTDWPPIYILDGPHKGKGIADTIISTLISKLPEYEHSLLEMNSKRVREMIKNGERVCNVTALPRDFYLTSKLNIITFNQRIFIRDNKAGLLNQQETISLSEIMSKKELTAGVSMGRYPKILNNTISKYLNDSHIIDTPEYEGLLKMLFTGRVDYIIEYPMVMKYH